jgi:pantoate--beta-alanine ligase
MVNIERVGPMREFVAAAHREGQRVALVPTMGALHEGHAALVRAAKARADLVVATIFVNPSQFGPNEDYTRYPRTPDADFSMLAEEGVDAVFVPRNEEIYPEGPGSVSTWIEVQGLDEHLCGRFRPGHFRGVATVVGRLFNICRPDVAVFGLKDAQQFVILNRMVRDLHFGVEMVGAETVRDPDGLALSSRNRYLTEEERAQAPVIFQALAGARGLLEQGEQRPEALVEAIRDKLAGAPDCRPQYVEVVSADTLHPPESISPGDEVLVATAVFFGRTRLIDSVFVRAPGA